MGKLVFMRLRDDSGDLQISVSKKTVDDTTFELVRALDYADIVLVGGRVGRTQKGEICIWANRIEIHSKSLVPPPEKYHGLADPELRYRQRYVDMYVNEQTMHTFKARSELLRQTRLFMSESRFLEVETPMMQPVAGGAAARPFTTSHNALDMTLFLRIAPELYLKRLLVGGMRRVYEIGRSFRNEGVDRKHNPEFTSLEAYEAFGDCDTMLTLTEKLLSRLVCIVLQSQPSGSATDMQLPFGNTIIDWSVPFPRVSYADLFERQLGFAMTDRESVVQKARQTEIDPSLDHWLLVAELFDRFCEESLDPARPCFVTDYPSAISPLTREYKDRTDLCERWELFAGGMEIGTAYTELNDPEVQLDRFSQQLRGANDEDRTLRTVDDDFIQALRVGMPPAGGLGIGIDRVVMLLTNSTSIRDVILFPLLRPKSV
jgi:lysyl-tRNA synthetase class 2